MNVYCYRIKSVKFIEFLIFYIRSETDDIAIRSRFISRTSFVSKKRHTRIQYVWKNMLASKDRYWYRVAPGGVSRFEFTLEHTVQRLTASKSVRSRVNSRMLRKRRRDGRIRKQRSSSSSSTSVIDSALLELRFVIRSYDETRIKKSPLSIYESVKTLVRDSKNKSTFTNPPFILQAWRCASAGLFPRRWERPIDRSFLASGNFGHGDCTVQFRTNGECWKFKTVLFSLLMHGDSFTLILYILLYSPQVSIGLKILWYFFFLALLLLKTKFIKIERKNTKPH